MWFNGKVVQLAGSEKMIVEYFSNGLLFAKKVPCDDQNKVRPSTQDPYTKNGLVELMPVEEVNFFSFKIQRNSELFSICVPKRWVFE